MAARTDPITSRHIYRWRNWKKKIISYLRVSFTGVGVFLILFLVVGFAPLHLPKGITSPLSTLLLGLLSIFILALVACVAALGVLSFWGDRLERGSVGQFLTDPRISYEEKRRALGVITGSGFEPVTQEEQIWYNLVLQHWAELYQHGNQVIPAVVALLGNARLFVENEGKPVVEHLADLIRFSGEEGTTALLGCMDGDNERACANAALLLGELREERALAPLLGMITTQQGRSSDLQQNVAVALGRFKDSQTVRPLLHLTSSANERLQRTALRALLAQGDAVLRAAWREEEDPVLKTRLRKILGNLEQAT